MSTPIDNEKYPPSGDGAKLPGLASPSTDINQLRTVVDGLKEIVEVREGRRGSRYDQVVTWRDLYNVGLVAVQSGGNTFINRTGSGGVAGVTLLAPNLQALMAQEFDNKVKASAAYKDLTTEIGVAAAYKGAPQEVVDVLTNNLLDEAIKRGADIRNVETKIQEVDRSLALSVRELTASVDGAQASAREVLYASATRDQATAGLVTTVKARLDNFGGGGVTVEQKMTTTVNRVTGLEGIYSVKVVVDNNGTPYISGFALSSTVTAGGAATSSFVVNASNFAIYRPGTTSVAPFGVDAGTNTVFINGTLLINSGGTTINALSADTIAATAAATAATSAATSATSAATSATSAASAATAATASKLSKAGADVLTGPISLQASNTILVGTTNDGIAIGSSGIIGRKASVTTFSVAADGTAIFKGDITGASGTFTGSVQSAASGNRVILNESSSSYIKVYDGSGGTIFSLLGVSGLYANSTINGASAIAALSVTNASGYSGSVINATNYGSGHGILADSQHTGTTRNGVLAFSAGTGAGAAAVYAVSNGGSFGMYCYGRLGISDSTLVTNLNAQYLNGNLASAFYVVGAALGTPSSGNLTNCTFPTLNQSTTGNAATATTADALGGYSASSWARIFVGDSGTANAGGSGMNFNCTISGQSFSGSGNTLTLAAVSDRRLKENIQPEILGLNFINALLPVTYNMIGKQRKAHGFIHDQVAHLISGDNDSLNIINPDGMGGVDYMSLIAPLVKSVQELSAKVAALESVDAS